MPHMNLANCDRAGIRHEQVAGYRGGDSLIRRPCPRVGFPALPAEHVMAKACRSPLLVYAALVHLDAETHLDPALRRWRQTKRHKGLPLDAGMTASRRRLISFERPQWGA